MRQAAPTINLEYRIYPNEDQKKAIFQTLKGCQFVYNHYLKKHIEDYNSTGKTMSFFDCTKDLTNLLQENAWLREADSQALRYAIKELYNQFNYFFKTKTNYPKYIKNHTTERHYKTVSNNHSIKITSYGIQLPKLGKVSAVDPNNFSFTPIEQPKDEIISATIYRRHGNQFFVTLHCKAPQQTQNTN